MGSGERGESKGMLCCHDAGPTRRPPSKGFRVYYQPRTTLDWSITWWCGFLCLPWRRCFRNKMPLQNQALLSHGKLQGSIILSWHRRGWGHVTETQPQVHVSSAGTNACCRGELLWLYGLDTTGSFHPANPMWSGLLPWCLRQSGGIYKGRSATWATGKMVYSTTPQLHQHRSHWTASWTGMLLWSVCRHRCHHLHIWKLQTKALSQVLPQADPGAQDMEMCGVQETSLVVE